jgi:pyruvate,water dikinase
MDTVTKPRPTFEPPGPGSWDLDGLHFPRPVTGYWAEMHPEPFSLGFGDMVAFYGAPFQTRVTAYVSGFAYGQMQPLPPESFPDRVQRAAEVFEGKLWRDQTRSGRRFASRPPCTPTARSKRLIPMS